MGLRIHLLALSFLSFYCFMGCDHKGEGMTLESSTVLDSIPPSGSGIIVEGDIAYIIGDDATVVYKYNVSNGQHKKVDIPGFDSKIYRESKPVKHDFEAACIIDWNGSKHLFAPGSGSLSPFRDSALMLNLSDNGNSRVLSMHAFYQRLQQLTNTDSKAWNIEGATVIKDDMVLCNRGNNLVMRFNLQAFINCLINQDTLYPTVTYHRLKLPAIEGKEARLSGACTLDDTHILFCASVEDTDDWTRDGPILGSFIGVLSTASNSIEASYLLKDSTGKPLKEKIESLDIAPQKATRDKIAIIAIGDNDNGSSTLFRLRIPGLAKSR